MNEARCVKLLALAVVAVCMGGKVEARGASHGSRTVGHSARVATHGFARTTLGGNHTRQASWQTYSRYEHLALRGRSGRHIGYSGGGGIQCVTFARADSGIELSGNANTWWDNAAGVYQRGNRPEPGSVLNFRSNGAMRMGHVAVVDEVVDGRTVVVDHANWGGPGAVPGGVSRNISVVDVSPNNDWSAVRVALGHTGEYGSIYPTFGFIYNRPDRGMIVASADTSTAIPDLNPAPRDLRPRDQSYDEVAEAPDSAMPSYSHHTLRRRHHGLTINSRHTTTHHHGS
jgi:hypothetical protein